jgi:hypothetical protein
VWWSTANAGACEMEEVAGTLRALDIEPIMAEAIVRLSAQLGLKQRFGGEAPKSYREMLDAIAKMSAVAD